MAELTQEELKDILNYDHESGIFTWKQRSLNYFKDSRSCNTWNTRYASKVAGGKRPDGYLRIVINYKRYFAHRLAWLNVYGEWPRSCIDHINGIKEDNRIVNLRDSTSSENWQNLKKAHKSNKSTGLIGSTFNKQMGKFQAAIRTEVGRKHIGYFESAQQAHEAYIAAKRIFHPYGML